MKVLFSLLYALCVLRFKVNIMAMACQRQPRRIGRTTYSYTCFWAATTSTLLKPAQQSYNFHTIFCQF
jgi:hypothetical protein